MPSPKKAETPVPPVEKSKAQKLSDFIKQEGIVLTQDYSLSISEKFKEFAHPAVQAAIDAGVIQAKLTLQVK